jgi:hypothetical protein
MARGGRVRALLRALGSLLLGVVVILLVALALFPFDRLEPVLIARLERETRARASLDRLSVGVSWRGPYAELEGLSLSWPNGSALAFQALRVSPALSLDWLRGAPAASLTSAAAFGSFEGVASGVRLAGNVQGLDLAQLPPDWFGEGGAPLEGPIDAQIDLAHTAEQWHGTATFHGANGVLALPGMPVAIPYQHLSGGLRIDPVGNLSLDSIVLRGPLASAIASGTVAAGYTGPATGAVDLTIDVEHLEPALVPALVEYGVPLDAAGAGQIHVGGTPDQIEIR